MNEDFENDGEQLVNDAYKKGANAVSNGVKKGASKVAGKATKKVTDKAKKGAGKVARKATKAVAKAGKKATKKAIQLAGKLLAKLFLAVAQFVIAFLPYILIAIIVILLVYFIWDLLFNSKGKTESYQDEDADEYNEVEMKGDGSVGATELSQGNKIVKAFYTYFSERSLWITVQKGDGSYDIENPIQYNSKTFVEKYGEDGEGGGTNGTKLKDKYGREKLFFINPNALYVLDEFLNKGNFRFPEQFVKPVRYDKSTYSLLPLIEDDGAKETLVAESIKYIKSADGKTMIPDPSGAKEKGTWDYGLGSVVNYKEFNEDYENRGDFTKVMLWNVTEGTLTGEMPIETAEQLLENTKNNPHKDDASYGVEHADYGTYGDVYDFDMSKIPDDYKRHVKTDLVYMIDKVVSPAGSISNDIYHEFEKTSKKFKDPQEFSQKVRTRESKTENVWAYDNGIQPPVTNPDGSVTTPPPTMPVYKQVFLDKDGADTFEPKDAEGNANAPKTKTTWSFKTENKNIVAYAEGYEYAKIPRYVGEPDLTNITGNKYYTDYMSNYQAYVPDDVMTKFDFKERTGNADDELLKILDKEIYKKGGSNVAVDLDHFQLGSGASAQVFMNAMQYFDKFQKWGDTYGVDPYILVAIASQESGGKHDDYIDADRCSIAGCGLMQVEKPGIGKTSASAYNHLTKSTDTIPVTYADATDVDKNIRIGAMEFASRAKDKHYNLLVALQGYNYGSGGINRTILKHLDTQGTASLANYPATEAVDNYIKSLDGAWISSREWYSSEGNPDGCMFFGSGSCPGDPQYLEHVLRYYGGPADGIGDGVPWAKDESGAVFTLSGATGLGAGSGTGNGVSVSSQSSSQDGWLKSGWNTIKAKWNQLFPEKEIELPKERQEFKNGQKFEDAETTLKMMFVMEEKRYLTDYDRFTSEDWKSQFNLLFSNPMGGKWKGSSVDKIDVDSWFPTGYTTPLSIKPLTIQKLYEPPSHMGVDIVAPPNSDVLAVSDGVVESVNESSSNDIGKYLTIKHEGGVKTLYGNLQSIDVKAGDTVTKGGKVGTTGDGKEGRVLHFELEKDGVRTDPSWIVTGFFNADDYKMSPEDAEIANQVIALAKQQIGKPYVWGARGQVITDSVLADLKANLGASNYPLADSYYIGKQGFDCSGFTQWLYKQVTTVDIGTTTYEQDKKLSSFKFGNVADLKPGDIIMASDLGHVVLYIGDNKIIHASNPAMYPKGGVKEGTIYNGLVLYYRPIGYINQVKSGS